KTIVIHPTSYISHCSRFFILVIPLPPTPTLFPYTTLFRSHRHPKSAYLILCPADSYLERSKIESKVRKLALGFDEFSQLEKAYLPGYFLAAPDPPVNDGCGHSQNGEGDEYVLDFFRHVRPLITEKVSKRDESDHPKNPARIREQREYRSLEA